MVRLLPGFGLDLLLDGQGRVSRVAVSGFCFGVALLTKETAIFLLPAMLFIAVRERRRHQGRFAVIGWVLPMMMLTSWYPLYAALKGELLPMALTASLFGDTRPHVSLIETLLWQSKRDGGGMFNLDNQFWQMVRADWMVRDPILLVGGAAATALNLLRGIRNRQVLAVALLGLFPLYYLARGGLVFNFYIVFAIPFFCLNIAVLLAPLRRAFGAIGALVLLLSVAAGTLLAWRATRPLREVSETARRILETGDFAARVRAPRGSGELAVLVRQLNTLLNKNATHVRVLRETLDNLAHDLRTPLARLRGTAELALQNAQDPAEARGALADCVNESDRVLHLLETLLDISAAEAGALKLNRDRFDVRTLVEQAADLYREVAEERKITLTVEQPEPAEVDGDPIRLGQAINNLLDNALKYTPSGGRVVLATRAEPDDVVITVSDTGPGIRAEEHEAVFRRLYRGDASRSRRGLGLGLSLVKAIAEAHGGTVAVDDGPEGGARFIIRLRR
jgi:signal transduction histidine kinase